MRAAFRIAVIYAVLAGVYLFAASFVVGSMSRHDPDVLEFWQGISGIIFVAVSALIIFILVGFYAKGRHAVETRLRQSFESRKQLFDVGPQPALVYDTDNLQILAFNKAAQIEYGYTAAEVLGRPVSILHPHRDQDRLFAPGMLFRLPPRPTHFRHIRKDGSSLYAEVLGSPLEFSGREAVLMTIQDTAFTRAVEKSLFSIVNSRTVRVLRTDDVDLQMFFKLLFDYFFPMAVRYKAKLNLSLDSELPARMIVDRTRLEEIMRLLLKEALKFSLGGTVSVRVRAEGAVGHFTCLEFAVCDEGIPAEDRLFAPTAIQEAADDEEAPPLNFFVATQLCEILGADFQRTPGRGGSRRFTVRLPGASNEQGVFVVKTPGA